MSKDKNQCKITILKDGPYIVVGDVPLVEKIITPKGKSYEYKDGRELPQASTYALCRCGKTKTPPFCDGSHVESKFDGTETASKADYLDRIETRVEGPELELLDDGRCALARFCHQEHGDAWELTRSSDIKEHKEEAIKAATECPAGRLVIKDSNGEIIEPEYEPTIEILQDSEMDVSGPIFVKGNIPIVSSDGDQYEVRNRVTLCRCGKSNNKPFCDVEHVKKKYKDHE